MPSRKRPTGARSRTASNTRSASASRPRPSESSTAPAGVTRSTRSERSSSATPSMPLELLDRRAQRRLGDVQPLGRPRDVALLRHRDPVAHQAELGLHRRSLWHPRQPVLDAARAARHPRSHDRNHHPRRAARRRRGRHRHRRRGAPRLVLRGRAHPRRDQHPPHRGPELAPELLPDKDAAIVVYCANEPCPNSGIAAHVLASSATRTSATTPRASRAGARPGCRSRAACRSPASSTPPQLRVSAARAAAIHGPRRGLRAHRAQQRPDDDVGRGSGRPCGRANRPPPPRAPSGRRHRDGARGRRRSRTRRRWRRGRRAASARSACGTCRASGTRVREAIRAAAARQRLRHEVYDATGEGDRCEPRACPPAGRGGPGRLPSRRASAMPAGQTAAAGDRRSCPRSSARRRRPATPPRRPAASTRSGVDQPAGSAGAGSRPAFPWRCGRGRRERRRRRDARRGAARVVPGGQRGERPDALPDALRLHRGRRTPGWPVRSGRGAPQDGYGTAAAASSYVASPSIPAATTCRLVPRTTARSIRAKAPGPRAGRAGALGPPNTVMPSRPSSMCGRVPEPTARPRRYRLFDTRMAAPAPCSCAARALPLADAVPPPAGSEDLRDHVEDRAQLRLAVSLPLHGLRVDARGRRCSRTCDR